MPCIAGFDPGLQFVHEADVARSLRFALDQRLRGIFNVAADGLLPWSEIVALTGKRRWPLPPLGTAELAQALRRLGIVNLTPELLGLLRYGRGLDTQRLKDAGFTYLYDTPATIAAHVQTSRLRRSVGHADGTYRYEQDVEEFFRRSPAVVREPQSIS